MSKFVSGLKAKASNAASKLGGIKGKLAGMAIKNASFKNFIKTKLKIYLIFAGIGLVIIACIATLLESLFGNSSSAVYDEINSSSFRSTADSRALELYDKYGSYLGFSISEINQLANIGCESIKNNNDGYEAFTSKMGWMTDDRKSRVEELVKLAYDDSGNLKSDLSASNIASLEFYASSKEGKFLNSISVNDNVSMYTHVLRSEKYQFNDIKWMAYTHDNGASEVKKDGFTYNENLGLMYPTAGNLDVYEVMNWVSPYLMSSTIPYAYLSQSLYSSQSTTSMGTSLTDIYYQKEYGMSSDVGNFAYQVIKHGKSDIIINQYNLQSQDVTSSWEEYYDYNCSDKFKIVKETVTGKYYNKNGDYEEDNDELVSERYYLVVDSYVDGSNTHDDSNRGAFHNSRLNTETNEVETKKEKVVDKPNPTVSIQYKLASALAFDVYVTNSYDYKLYEDEDVENLTNANYESGVTSEELKRVSESTQSNHYTLEQLQSMTSDELKQIVENSNSKTESSSNVSGEVTQNTWDDGSKWVHQTETVEYQITGNSYTLEYGDTNYITRTWSDTLSSDPTTTRKVKLGLNDIVNFNKNTEKDPSRDTITADDFKTDSDSIAYYSSIVSSEDTSINVVDILDSNKKIFLNYMSGANAKYKYAGYTRSEYTVTKGNSLIKKEFDELANNNDGALPFVYGESFGYDTGAEEPSALGSSSGKRLLYEYIYDLEGTGTTKEEGGIKYYQVYTINGNRTVGHGLDLETSGKEGDLIELANRAGYSISTNEGDWIPADIVDQILDQEIENWYNVIVSHTQGLNLTEYQIHALTSRALNCGHNSYLAYETSPANGNINLERAVQTYWNAENDDFYEELFELYGGSEINSEQENEIINKSNNTHGLFTSYLAGPNNGGQLDNRRMSEWILFQTGYYGYHTNQKKFYGGSGGTILECAEYIHKYMEDNNYNYCVYGGNSYEECAAFGRSHFLSSTFAKSQEDNHPQTCCATFVSWVLQDAGYMTEEEHNRYGCNGALNIARFLENQKGWTRISDVSQLEPGDVMVYNYGHVQIYAGDNTYYNAGSGESIRRDSPYNGGAPNCDYGLRAPN